MHTIMVTAGGLLLLGLFLLVGRWAPPGFAGMARWFIPVWFVCAAINMWVGVSRAGYSVAEELPIFLVIFAIPAAIAGLLWWKFAR
jgi:hypothetical protein